MAQVIAFRSGTSLQHRRAFSVCAPSSFAPYTSYKCSSFPARSISFHPTSTVVLHTLSLLNKTAKRCRLLTKDKMNKVLKIATDAALKSFTKFTVPTVNRGKTAFPKTQGDLERLGVRWDYDGEVTIKDIVYNKFQMQPNAGKVPTSIKKWREAHGGTHAVMADVFVKKDGTEEDVKKGLDDGIKEVVG